MIESKTGQRLMGLLLIVGGAGFTGWMWNTALNEGRYNPFAFAIVPLIAVAGLGMLLFPMDVARLRAEHGVDKPQKLAHYPPAWKATFVVALLAGVGNWLAVSRL